MPGKWKEVVRLTFIGKLLRILKVDELMLTKSELVETLQNPNVKVINY